jgi:RNA 2',3'-cyclic 3'-phosphodiesterase
VSRRQQTDRGVTAPRPLRLFTALWPGEALAAEIARWQSAWRWPSQATRVKPERLHMTLHFLGDVAADRLAELAQCLKVPFDPFALELEAGELWPNGVAVLLAARQPPALTRLHTQLAQAVRRLGLPVEERPYRPHVTLARRAWGASRPTEPADLPWKVDSGYVLVHSLPGGAGYEILQRFP